MPRADAARDIRPPAPPLSIISTGPRITYDDGTAPKTTAVERANARGSRAQAAHEQYLATLDANAAANLAAAEHVDEAQIARLTRTIQLNEVAAAKHRATVRRMMDDRAEYEEDHPEHENVLDAFDTIGDSDAQLQLAREIMERAKMAKEAEEMKTRQAKADKQRKKQDQLREMKASQRKAQRVATAGGAIALADSSRGIKKKVKLTEKQKARLRAMGVPEDMDAAGGLSEYLKKLYDDDEDDAAAAVLAVLLGENIEDDEIEDDADVEAVAGGKAQEQVEQSDKLSKQVEVEVAEDCPEPHPEYLDEKQKIPWPECVSITDLMRDERVQAVVQEMRSKVKGEEMEPYVENVDAGSSVVA